MTNSKSMIQSLLRSHKHNLVVCDPPWGCKKNRSRRERHKYMSLAAYVEADMASNESGVKEGGYS